MKLKLSKTLPAAAAQAGISVATAYRFGHDPRLPSDKKAPRASDAGPTLWPISSRPRSSRCSRQLRASGRWRYSTS